MKKVPDRFLGYAFCVGDALLELDGDFRIRNADGATQTVLGLEAKSLTGVAFLSWLLPHEQEMVKGAVSALTGKNRLGPILVHLDTVTPGSGDMKDPSPETAWNPVDPRVRSELIANRRPSALFLTRLDMKPGRIFAVLSLPHRIGLASERVHEDARSPEEKKQDFLTRVGDMLSDDPDGNLSVTVLETAAGHPLSTSEQDRIDRLLNSMSVGGGTAASLDTNKFAVLHDSAPGGHRSDFVGEIERRMGVRMASATMNTQEADLRDDDSVRAILFGLQKFAEGAENYTIQAFEDGYADLIDETAARVREFRQVLDKGGFSLVYQPIVDMKTGRTHHFEALSRFDRPTPGYSQFDMICFAEDVGLIMDFDRAVMDRAAKKLLPMVKRDADTAPKLAVNVSGRSLSSQDFVAHLLQRLEELSLLSGHLSLEITESSKIQDLETLGDALSRIKTLGFKVYLDDFGVGAAGFQYLRDLKVDALKIDGSYIRDAVNSKIDQAFLKSMISLCQELDIITVGEWIETRRQADLLRRLGVTYGQGYYFSRPKVSLVNVKVNYQPGSDQAAVSV